LGVDFRAVLVKAVPTSLPAAPGAGFAQQRAVVPHGGADELNRIRAWADQTAEGSLQDLAEQPPADVWGAVCAERGNCDGVRCRHYRACFLTRARAQMRTANLLVVNHYLLFSELKLRAQGAAILPNYTSLVLDEAHMVEGVATDHLGMRISHYMFEYWLRRLYTPDTGKGLLKLIRHGEAANEVTRAWEEAERFFGLVRDWAAFTTEETQRVVAAPLDLPTNLPQQIGRVTAVLRRIVDGLGEQEEIRAELNSARQLGAEMKDELEAFLEQSWPDQVYWVESEGKRRQQTVPYSARSSRAMLGKSLSRHPPA
jgi:ATP-dependent DNA helicase DinG